MDDATFEELLMQDAGDDPLTADELPELTDQETAEKFARWLKYRTRERNQLAEHFDRRIKELVDRREDMVSGVNNQIATLESTLMGWHRAQVRDAEDTIEAREAAGETVTDSARRRAIPSTVKLVDATLTARQSTKVVFQVITEDDKGATVVTHPAQLRVEHPTPWTESHHLVTKSKLAAMVKSGEAMVADPGWPITEPNSVGNRLVAIPIRTDWTMDEPVPPTDPDRFEYVKGEVPLSAYTDRTSGGELVYLDSLQIIPGASMVTDRKFDLKGA